MLSRGFRMNTPGFMLHPWVSFLYPIVFLLGLAVCVRFWRVSRHVPLLIAGFAGLALPYVVVWIGAYRLFTSLGSSIFISTVDPVARLLLIVGLGMVFEDFRGRTCGENGDSESIPTAPGRNPTRSEEPT